MNTQANNLMDGDTPITGLRRKSVQSAAVTGFAQFSRTAIQIGGTAILARMISPEEFGLIAMVAVITGFLTLLKDLGLSAATIQKADISHEQVSTLFWANVAIGAIAMLVTCLLAPLVSRFYSEPRLTEITLALSIVFLLGGFAVQPRALLSRRLSFRAIAINDIVSHFFGTACAVYMALSGYGYWALVGQLITTSMADLCLTFYLVRWKPSPPNKLVNVKHLLKFGSDVAIFNSVNYFSRSVDNLLIGWYWGAAPLALYSKAYGLLILPIRQINAPLMSVSTPVLSKLQDDAQKFKSYFLSSFLLIASVTIPMIILLAAFAEEVIMIVLGPNWDGAAKLFQLLAPAAAMGALANPVGSLLLPLGLSQKYRTLGIVNSSATLTSFVIGLPFGPMGVAASFSGASVLIAVFSWWYATKGTPVCLKDIANTLVAPCVSASFAAALAYAVHSQINTGQYVSAFFGLFTFILAYLATLLFGFKKLAFFRSLIGEFSGRR